MVPSRYFQTPEILGLAAYLYHNGTRVNWCGTQLKRVFSVVLSKVSPVQSLLRTVEWIPRIDYNGDPRLEMECRMNNLAYLLPVRP